MTGVPSLILTSRAVTRRTGERTIRAKKEQTKSKTLLKYFLYILLKESLDNTDNSCLLFLSNLYITSQAQPSGEDISSYISVFVYCDEIIMLEDWLKMHRFPDRPALYVLVQESFHNLLVSYLCILFINQDTGEPVVRLTVCCMRIHRNRQIFESLFIGFINLPLLLDMLIKVNKLTSPNTSNNIAHTVVVPDLTMLVVGSRVS
jgi:hypothetical protein